MIRKLRFVWLVSFYVYLWWWRCWIWARYFYLNMGVKLVMVKDQSLARRSVCYSMTVERMLWGSDRYSNPVQMVLEGWLLSIISFWLACNCVFDWYYDYLWACFEKDKTQASMIIGHWKSNIEKVFLDCYWKLDYALLMLSDARVRWKSRKTITPRILILAWLGW